MKKFIKRIYWTNNSFFELFRWIFPIKSYINIGDRFIFTDDSQKEFTKPSITYEILNIGKKNVLVKSCGIYHNDETEMSYKSMISFYIPYEYCSFYKKEIE